MSQLVIGLSHHSAALPLLEQAMLSADDANKLAQDIVAGPDVAESVLLVTCNRVEVIAEVERFHAGVDHISQLLADRLAMAREELAPSLYVHFAERAVQHVFAVASGLDSMVPGESQVLGQVRRALRRAQDDATVGRELHDLLQQALRVGKRVQAETDLGRIGRSVVSVGLASAAAELGGLAGRVAVVVGAGTMSSLVVRTLHDLDVGEIVVANRTHERAVALAAAVGGRAVPLGALASELAHADLVVSCTGSVGHVLGVDDIAAARVDHRDRPLFMLDLAVPRDVHPDVAGLPGVRVLTLADVPAAAGQDEIAAEIQAARDIVATEVALFAGHQRAAQVAPTVVALRSMAASVVAAEVARLQAKVPDLDRDVLAEVRTSLRRVVDKLIHAPTVRVKELAASATSGPDYAEALRELFALDPRAVDALASYEEPVAAALELARARQEPSEDRHEWAP